MKPQMLSAGLAVAADPHPSEAWSSPLEAEEPRQIGAGARPFTMGSLLRPQVFERSWPFQSTTAHARTSASLHAVHDGIEISIERDPVSASERLTGSDAAWPARLRRTVRAALNLWGRPDLAETAELLTTELVTNAFQHGTGPDVGFRVYLGGDHLVIEARDGSPVLPQLRSAGPDDENGRGLFLVDAMADAWGTSLDGTTTWCSLCLCKGLNAPMNPVTPPVPVLREYPAFGLPGNASAPARARTLASTALLALGWTGSVPAATEVLARLVQNAVDHGLTPERTGTISAHLSINEENQLLIDVSDPNPHFPAFAAAVRGERGRGLWDVQRLQAEVTWFRLPSRDSGSGGKTVRATLTDGTVTAAHCDR